MNKTWSDGIIAAHEPYLLTVHRGALLLWDRRTPEPFAVSKEPYVRTMIILAENQLVPGESSSVGFFFDIHFLSASGLYVFIQVFIEGKILGVFELVVVPTHGTAGLPPNLALS